MKNVIYFVPNVLISVLVFIFFKLNKFKRNKNKMFGRSFIIRKRKNLQRKFSFTKGECFYVMHIGLWAINMEHKQGRSVSFKSIKDDEGKETID